MKALPRVVGDVLLAVFAVVVFAGAVYVVKQGGAPAPGAKAVSQVQPERSGQPSSQPAGTPSRTSQPRAILLLGPDLAKMGPDLARATGDAIEVKPAPLTPDVEVSRTPDLVVLQILAGTRTGARTTEAIKAIRDRWSSVVVVVVGPFSSEDRKSAAAVKTAAAASNVLSLDPVDLQWRADAASATVEEADFRVVATQLAAALP